MHISGVGGERERAARYLDSVNSANANFWGVPVGVLSLVTADFNKLHRTDIISILLISFAVFSVLC